MRRSESEGLWSVASFLCRTEVMNLLTLCFVHLCLYILTYSTEYLSVSAVFVPLYYLLYYYRKHKTGFITPVVTYTDNTCRMLAMKQSVFKSSCCSYGPELRSQAGAPVTGGRAGQLRPHVNCVTSR